MQLSERDRADLIIGGATLFGIFGAEMVKTVFQLLSVNYDHDDGNSFLNYITLPVSFLIAFGLYRMYRAWGEDIYKTGFLVFMLLHLVVVMAVFAGYKSLYFIVYLLVGIALDMVYSLWFLTLVTRSRERSNE